MNKPTPGPWKKGERVPERHAIRILAEDGSLVAEARGAGGPWAEVNGNAEIILAAHNVCAQLNPSNPLAVAEAMGEVVGACRETSRFLSELSGNGVAHVQLAPAIGTLGAALAKLEVK